MGLKYQMNKELYWIKKKIKQSLNFKTVLEKMTTRICTKLYIY